VKKKGSAYESIIAEIVDRFLKTEDFWSTEVEIPAEERANWICMRNNPKHFTSAMFLGDWSDTSKSPGDEKIRLLRVMEMPDESLRIIGRQDQDLFVLMLK
jgi:hypothetical protein